MNFLAIFIGGGLGALIRYTLTLLVPAKYYYFPYCTLLANIVGCFLAGVVLTYFIAKSDMNSTYKLFLITGFCGGLTTFSTFSLEVINYIQNGDYLRASSYIVISLFICLISVILGIFLVKKYV